MSEEKHTPGPWFERREGFSTVYIEARIGAGMIQEVAACGPTLEQEQQSANAWLISEAPSLLKALQSIQECCEEGSSDRDYASRQSEIRGIARAAIKRATGYPT